MISLNKKLELNKEVVASLQNRQTNRDEKMAWASCLLYSCQTKTSCNETKIYQGK